MTPKEQLDALGERLLGIVGAAYVHSRQMRGGDATEADKIEGGLLRTLIRRADKLHADYSEFLRAQVEAAKSKPEVKK